MTDIDASLRNSPVIDKDGYAYLIHPLADGVPRAHPDLLIQWAEWSAGQTCIKGATVLLAPEAMALPLAAATSMKTGLPYLVIRKREYGLEGERLAYCETGYGQSCLYINGLRAGDRVVLVDDVISTGGTIDALLGTLASMDVQVQGVLTFIEKGGHLQALRDRHGVPIEAMRSVELVDGQVNVVE